MKTVTTKSGIKGWQCNLQENYPSLEIFLEYDRNYNVSKRLDYASPEDCWADNPVIQGSVNPQDFCKVEPETKVIFRKYRKGRYSDGGVIAIFPEDLGDSNVYTCMSYMHVGQHGSCDPHVVIQTTKLAKPEEYADLYQELTSIGYNLKIYQKYQYDFLKVREKEMARINGTGE